MVTGKKLRQKRLFKYDPVAAFAQKYEFWKNNSDIREAPILWNLLKSYDSQRCGKVYSV